MSYVCTNINIYIIYLCARALPLERGGDLSRRDICVTLTPRTYEYDILILYYTRLTITRARDVHTRLRALLPPPRTWPPEKYEKCQRIQAGSPMRYQLVKRGSERSTRSASVPFTV